MAQNRNYHQSYFIRNYNYPYCTAIKPKTRVDHDDYDSDRPEKELFMAGLEVVNKIEKVLNFLCSL